MLGGMAGALIALRYWTMRSLEALLAYSLPLDAPTITVIAQRIRARYGIDPRPRPLKADLERSLHEIWASIPRHHPTDDPRDLEADPPDLRFVEEMMPARGAPSTWQVPPILAVPDLGLWLGVSPTDLASLADDHGGRHRAPLGRFRHYFVAARPKQAGGTRIIERPKTFLKRVQRKILRGILDRIPPHAAAHGFVRGRSALTHANLHAGKEVVLRFDLRDFFATVNDGHILSIFRYAGYPEGVARALVALTTHALSKPALREMGLDVHGRLAQHLSTSHLPQGAPTSPALANLAAYRLDVRLAGLARTLGATYSRYADDLVFSGGRNLARHAGAIEARVGAIAIESRFALNHRKTRRLATSTRQVVGGWVVNAHPALARDAYDRLRATLHEAVTKGPAIANRERHPSFRAHIEGRIARVAETSPRRAEKLRAMAARVAW